MWEYITLILLILILSVMYGPKKEGYFDLYQPMPIINKTYLSPHFVRNVHCGTNTTGDPWTGGNYE
jgi:hypothetical protein